jgi:hypothetical protein
MPGPLLWHFWHMEWYLSSAWRSIPRSADFGGNVPIPENGIGHIDLRYGRGRSYFLLSEPISWDYAPMVAFMCFCPGALSHRMKGLLSRSIFVSGRLFWSFLSRRVRC